MHKVKVIYLLAAGLAVSAVAVFLLTGIDAQTSLAGLGWRLAVFGLSVAIMLTTVSVAAINAVPWQQAGMAAAANTALRQYGSALGPAILGVIFVARTNSGASPTTALHTALIVNGILLAAAGLACLLAARAPKRHTTKGR
jgi:MFS family permease